MRSRPMILSLASAGAGALLAWSVTAETEPAMIEIALIEPAGKRRR